LISIVSFSFFAVPVSAEWEPLPFKLSSYPGAYHTYGYQETNIENIENLKKPDGWFTEAHTTAPAIYSADYLVSWDFNDATYPDGEDVLIPDDLNDTIGVLKVVLTFPSNTPVMPGHFSIGWDTEDYWVGNNPEIYGSWYDSDNTSYYDGLNSIPAESWGNVNRTGNIYTWTVLQYLNGSLVSPHNFTVSDIISEYSLKVMWYFTDYTSTSSFDYLGIQYIYYSESTTEFPLIDVPELSFSSVIYGMIWLILIFLPALLLSVFLPKAGFMVGMCLMIFILGVTESGFYFITILGMVAIGIMIFKGE
jgi:hypothetical protein